MLLYIIRQARHFCRRHVYTIIPAFVLTELYGASTGILLHVRRLGDVNGQGLHWHGHTDLPIAGF